MDIETKDTSHSSGNVTPAYVYVNGEVVTEGKATVPVKDRGFLYGDAIFETLRSYNGRPFLLGPHLERLSSSAHALGIPLEKTLDELTEVVLRLLETNGLKDAYIRITVSRGTGGDGLVPAEAPSPTLIIETRPFKPYPDALYENGMRLIISDYTRSTTNPALRHKTRNFLVPIMARQEASRKDAQDALFLNTEGDVCEGTVWNIFMVEGSSVITPSLKANLLPGITRETVLKICDDTGIAASEELFGVERLLAADEVFATNSLMEVMPVASIDGRLIGQKIPANITRRLMGEYKKLTLT